MPATLPLRAESERSTQRGALAAAFFAAFDAGRFDRPLLTASATGFGRPFVEDVAPLLKLVRDTLSDDKNDATLFKVLSCLQVCAANGITVAQEAVDAICGDYVAEAVLVLELVEREEEAA